LYPPLICIRSSKSPSPSCKNEGPSASCKILVARFPSLRVNASASCSSSLARRRMASAPPASSASTSLTPEETAGGVDASPPREATAASASASPVLRRHSTPDLPALVRLHHRRGRRRPGRAAAHGAAAVGVRGPELPLHGEATMLGEGGGTERSGCPTATRRGGATIDGNGGAEGQLAGEGEEDGERRETVAVLGLRCNL